jgi:hypothetical protein
MGGPAPASGADGDAVDEWLAWMAAVLANGDAVLTTHLGRQREQTSARLWRGQVLVDWEPDETAGGCLVRPAHLRRLLVLHAKLEATHAELRLRASGQVLQALSPEHRELVAQLGGAERVELRLELRRQASGYRGTETYVLRGAGRATPLLQLEAEVRQRTAEAGPGSPRSTPATR